MNVKATLTRDRRQGYLDGMAKSRSVCCSFCNKDKDAVTRLIAGPGVYICNECVHLCDLILAEEQVRDLGSWSDRPDDELLARLGKVQAVVSQVDTAVHDHVTILRDRGISWTRIGQALGVSKQAAWERFSGED